MDRAYRKAIDELSSGLHDGDLGGHVFKKRLPLPGKGKRGSVRTLIAAQAGKSWFFIYGFRKTERANITAGELEALQTLASDLLALRDEALETLIRDGALEEVADDHT